MSPVEVFLLASSGVGLLAGLLGHTLPASPFQRAMLSLAALLPGNVAGAVHAAKKPAAPAAK